MKKKFFKKANLYLTIAIVSGILAVVNFFSFNIFHRFDLTRSDEYSISPASRQLLGRLDDVVNIKVYFSKNLPSQYLSLRQEVGDILDEYVNYSHGQVRLEYISPADDDETMQKMYLTGIPPVQFSILEKDKYQVVRGYLGIAIEHKDQREIIPVVKDASNLEYQITLAVKKVSGQKTAQIGWLKGYGTLDTAKEISAAYGELAKMYDLSFVDLSAKEISGDLAVLIIAGPQEKIGEEELKKIDNFIMRGGSVLVLLDEVKVEQNLEAAVNGSGLDKLLAAYGIKVNPDLVLDAVSGVASFNQDNMVFSINYPFWPDVQGDGFNKENPAVADLESVVFPWVSSVEADKNKLTGQVIELVKTSARSWKQSGQFSLQPDRLPAMTNTGQNTLALAYFGELQSPYSSKKAESRLVVAGDRDFARDNFLSGSSDNLTLFQNLVDLLSLDEDLIKIRSKAVAASPIKELSDKEKMELRYFNVFGVAVAVVLFGVLRFFLRRRKRKVNS